MSTRRRSTREFLDLSDRVLARGHAVRFRAEGWSMYPTIQDGDTVEVIPVELPDIRRGDVLLCRLGSGSVAHRVVGIHRAGGSPTMILLRGDASFATDPPVGEADILGRVIATTRGATRRRLDTTSARLRGRLVARAWRAKRRAADAVSRRRRCGPGKATVSGQSL